MAPVCGKLLAQDGVQGHVFYGSTQGSSVINPPAGNLAASETPAPISCFPITSEASLAVCILAALLATGACLQCEVCLGPGTSCTGDLQTTRLLCHHCVRKHRLWPSLCSGCRRCRSGRGINLCLAFCAAGVKSQNITKTCATPIQGKADLISVTSWNGETVRMNISCCVGDACRATTVPLPPADTKPNSRSCPGCIISNSSYCQQGTIECTGAETQSFYSIKRIGGDDAFDILHGCTTKSYCAMLMEAFDVVPGDSVVPVMDVCTTTCETADTGLAGLFLSALAGILLLTLLSCLCG
ncbi:phospholipase A2 inhibitor NAI-like [Dermochelys coriacea]|uniref:phospholipase A2 inhibitor NAI-like n=1 Tax=Dermochelys coriacea TaxID=27794 RepID=UPI001CA8547D|nr:phospholipase A2 inhibitor NAI-like [Dermochelys coriacea]